MDNSFAKDVKSGLLSSPKSLPSRYFYNEHGDDLFRAIMRMEEYYPTKSEFEILLMNKATLLSIFYKNNDAFQLIEFGAGDGFKTKILLRYFLAKKANFIYIPIDISANVLDILIQTLNRTFPELKVTGIRNDYFTALKKLNLKEKTRKVILFLGSNIGNFNEEEALDFLKQVGGHLSKGDLLLIGFDLKKDPGFILDAYNDRSGITRAFNLNLLKRINDELGGNFDISKFEHYPVYDPLNGEARSYLVSREKQTVNIAAPGISINFEAWEPIHMEISKKYDLPDILQLADKAGFKVCHNMYDCKHYYLDSVWELK